MPLLLFPAAPVEDPAASPLGRSLAAQTDDRWRGGSSSSGFDAVVLVDDNAELRPHCVATIIETLELHPSAIGLIADATVGGKRRYRPAWSPIRLLSNPGDLTMIVIRVGALTPDEQFPTGLTGRISAARRLLATGRDVVHVPIALSDHPSPGDPDAAGIAELEGVVSDQGLHAHLEALPRTGTFRIQPRGAPPPMTVVIPTAGAQDPGGHRMVDRAIAAVRSESWPELDIVIVVGDEFEGDPSTLLDNDVSILERPPGPFNFALAANQGVLAARTELVLLLNDDTESDRSGWLHQLAVHLGDPEVAAVAPALLYPDHTIQHVGVVIDDAHPLHPFVGQTLAEIGDHDGDLARDVVAVSAACVLLRRSAYLSVGGMAVHLPLSFNDTDLCLKLRRSGGRIIVEPSATLLHHESATREPIIESWEWDAYIDRWGEVTDPWYHPAFVRPDDALSLRRNADHLIPPNELDTPDARGTRIHSRVHHSRLIGVPNAPNGPG